jgi:hypothetical protein
MAAFVVITSGAENHMHSSDSSGLAKLIRARTRLNEVSRQLREEMEATGTVVGARCRELQTQWDEALHAFEQLMDEVWADVKQHDGVEIRDEWDRGAELQMSTLPRAEN